MPRDNNGPLFDDVHADLRYDPSRRLNNNNPTIPTSTTTIRIVDGHTYDLVGRYSAPKTIGSGAFGDVISAWDNILQRKVAIKKIRLPPVNTDEAMLFYSRSLREICILPPLKHDNIVQVLDCYTSALCAEQMTEVYLVTNLMRLDLHQLIKTNKQRPNDMRIITASHITHFLYQILRALKFIHSAKVLHRDLKPGNIFIDLDGHLRIGDFGLARVPEENGETPMTSYVCTRWYRAPELMLLNGTYTASMDMWSVGCILAELIYGQPLYPGRHHLDQFRLIIEHRCGSLGFPYHQHKVAYPTITEKSLNLFRRTLSKCPNEYPVIFSPLDSNVFVPGVDKHAFELLEQLLRMDPSERITADDGLHSCLFDNYRKEASGEPSSEEAFQLDLSPYNLQEIRSMLFQKNPVGPLPPPPAPPIQSFNVWIQQQQEIHLRDQIIQQQQQQIQQLEQRVLQLENMFQLSSNAAGGGAAVEACRTSNRHRTRGRVEVRRVGVGLRRGRGIH